MRLAVFGATGRIGRHVVEQAVAQGHAVIAFVRDPSRLPVPAERLTVVTGDIGDPSAVETAVAGAGAVISALGPKHNTAAEAQRVVEGMRNVLAAMERHGVRRLVNLSGGAIRVPGEWKRPAGAIASAVVRLLARHVVAAKQREFELIRRSGLDWVAVRPPRVTDGPLTGRYRTGDVALGPRSRISNRDVADFMLRQLTDDSYLRQAPFVSY